MMSNRINYVVVGSFMLVMLVGLVVAVAMLTGRTGATDAYHTIYDNVTGIKFGTQVLYEGYPVGQVEKVAPIVEEGRIRFRVDVSVIEGWRIPRDSVAHIAASGLLAAVAVNIDAGSSKEALAPGGRIPSQEGESILAVVTSVASEVRSLTDASIKPLLASLNRAASSFADLLETDAQGLTRELTGLTQDLSARVPRIAGDLEAMIAKMNQSADQLQTMLNPETQAKVSAIVANMDAAAMAFAKLSTELAETRAGLDRVIESANTVIGDNRLDVEKTIVDMRYVVDSVARHIDAINQNLEGASRNMYEFSRQIRENPGLLLGGTSPPDQAKRR